MLKAQSEQECAEIQCQRKDCQSSTEDSRTAAASHGGQAVGHDESRNTSTQCLQRSVFTTLLISKASVKTVKPYQKTGVQGYRPISQSSSPIVAG